MLCVDVGTMGGGAVTWVWICGGVPRSTKHWLHFQIICSICFQAKYSNMSDCSYETLQSV